MRALKISFIIFILTALTAFILLGTTASAADYYVSRSGSNSGGTSWATAWSNLDQISWNVLSPGDTVYIDGGSSGLQYSGFTTRAGGTRGI